MKKLNLNNEIEVEWKLANARLFLAVERGGDAASMREFGYAVRHCLALWNFVRYVAKSCQVLTKIFKAGKEDRSSMCWWIDRRGWRVNRNPGLISSSTGINYMLSRLFSGVAMIIIAAKNET